MSEYCQTRCTACEAFLWGKATGAPRSHVTWLSHVTLLRGWSNFLRGLFTQDKPRCLASGLVGEPVVPSLSPICTFCRHWSPAVENKDASQTWRVDPTPHPCLIFAQSGCLLFLTDLIFLLTCRMVNWSSWTRHRQYHYKALCAVVTGLKNIWTEVSSHGVTGLGDNCWQQRAPGKGRSGSQIPC